ncbi:response regulator [Leptolyngbya sp. FACHB-261]|uniref:response regulator n=1 Tax=Leptolyngbya sp. FACHB-261 TaxID=2692806 RepID=UPI001685745D|nr:response regulator [Leptolyngbya sp. FACHB-261]MBD2102866.1 response regulator [Leptolyngbya sp. FACHB-261]
MSIDYRGIKKLANQFAILQRAQFSGRLDVASETEKQPWSFYCYLGRIVYATGGPHAVRRWRRNLACYWSEVEITALVTKVTEAEVWDYQALCLLADSDASKLPQIKAMIKSIVVEAVLDIAQMPNITCRIGSQKPLDTQLALIGIGEVFKEMQQNWQRWQGAGLGQYSPNLAPILRQPERLRSRIPTAHYQLLKTLLNGKQTLRDVAKQMKREVAIIAKFLAPYLQDGIIELVEISDLPAPVRPTIPSVPATLAVAPLIACLDDSPSICQEMEQILMGAGYRFIAIQDPLRALTTLLTRKPDLIFLDLVMPETNGYEICSKLRKTSLFRNTPIVILTGNDGIIDRVRAKIVGASDFLGKPVESKTVLEATRKHLAQAQTISA